MDGKQEERESQVMTGVLYSLVCYYVLIHVLLFSVIVDFWCFDTTFSNISAISWRPVLVVEEAGVPGENHRPWTSKW